MVREFESKLSLPSEFKIAPAGSKLRTLLSAERGSLSYVTFPPNRTGKAHMNKTVEEIWFFIQGIGEFWRKQGAKEEIVTVTINSCISIPPRTHFQYRNVGDEQICVLIATMPCWPEGEESIDVEGKWDLNSNPTTG